MVNQNKKIEKKYVTERMKEPMSRVDVYYTFKAMLDEFQNNYMKKNGFMLAQTVHFLNTLIQLLVKKGVFTQKEFDKLSQELGEQEKADYKEHQEKQKDAKKESDKKNVKEKDKKSDR